MISKITIDIFDNIDFTYNFGNDEPFSKEEFAPNTETRKKLENFEKEVEILIRKLLVGIV